MIFGHSRDDTQEQSDDVDLNWLSCTGSHALLYFLIHSWEAAEN